MTDTIKQLYRRYSDGTLVAFDEKYKAFRGYQHVQCVSSDVWEINHNKQSKSFIQNIFINNEEVKAKDITIIDNCKVIITFDEPQAGKVNFIFLVDRSIVNNCSYAENNCIPTSPTPTPTITPTTTITISGTPSISGTPTNTLTPTPTTTPTIEISPTPTTTPTIEISPTLTPTPTTSITPSITTTATDFSGNRISLLEFEDGAGSTTLNDPYGNQWSLVNTDAIVSTPVKFGGGSYYMLNNPVGTTSSRLDLLAKSEWTIRYWIYYNTVVNDRRHITIGGGNVSFGANGIHLIIQYSNFNLNVILAEGDGSTPYSINGGSAFEQDRWYHIEVSFDGTHLRGFVDGIQVIAGSSSLISRPTGNATFKIGQIQGELSNTPDAYMDEFEVYDIVLHTENFTPPSSTPLPSITQTVTPTPTPS